MHRNILRAIQALKATKRKRLYRLPRHPFVELIEFSRPLGIFTLHMRWPRLDYHIGIDINKLKKALSAIGYRMRCTGTYNFEITHEGKEAGAMTVHEVLGRKTPITIDVKEAHVEPLVTKLFAPTQIRRIVNVKKLPRQRDL